MVRRFPIWEALVNFSLAFFMVYPSALSLLAEFVKRIP